MVVAQFLDMCLTTGQQSATVESIFNKIDETLQTSEISWTNCEGSGVDTHQLILVKSADGLLRFKRLAKVALLTLVLPYFNLESF